MKNKKNHQCVKIICFTFLICFFLVGFEKGFGIGSGEVVIVREADLRFGPVPIPLNEKTKNELKSYIKAGGDKRNTGPVAFYLHNKKFYEELLLFLSRGTQISVSDVFAENKGLYSVNLKAKKWFKGPVVLSIIDATQKRPLSEQRKGPLAVSDGNLWWIFFRNQNNQIIGLLVTIR